MVNLLSLIGSTMSLESPERKRRVSSHPLLALRAFKNVQFPGASKGSFATRKRQQATGLHKTVCYRPYPGGAPPSVAVWSRSLLIYSCATPVRDSRLVKVCDLGPPLSALDFVSLHQPTRGHSLVDGPERAPFSICATTTVITNDTGASGRQGARL